MTGKTKQPSLATLLRNAGLKATRPRLEVLRILEKTKQPISVEDLHKKSAAKIGLATLYRVVDVLSQKGMLYKTHLGERVAYEFHGPGDHHHHVTCTSCGKIEDIVVERLEPLMKRPTLPRGFRSIERHMLEFFGLCRKCSS